MFPTLLIAFLSLIFLMIIHEFGHFIIAKKFGVGLMDKVKQEIVTPNFGNYN